jgi:hypothetical protein
MEERDFLVLRSQGYDRIACKILTFMRNHTTFKKRGPYPTQLYYCLYQLAWWFTKDILSFSATTFWGKLIQWYILSHSQKSLACFPPLLYRCTLFVFTSPRGIAFSGRYWASFATVLLSSWIFQTDFYFLNKD